MAINNQISVVIPTFNRANSIGRTLNSIFLQEIPASEIVVVDDGSTDDTSSTIEILANLAPLPVRLIQQKNAGPGHARNIGAAAANFPYILFLDSDDLLTPAAIKRFREAIERYNFPDMISGGRITLLPGIKKRQTIPPPLKTNNWDNFEDEIMSLRPTIGIGAAIVKREFALIHPFPESFRICEDLVFFAHSLLYGNCVSFPDAQVEINQQTHHAFRNPELLLAEHEMAYQHALNGIPSSPFKANLRKKLRAYPALRTFRELHRAGLDKDAQFYYMMALSLNPMQALKLTHLRKFLRGLLGIKHPASLCVDER